MLLIDDLQWADAGSLRLLRVLADRPQLRHLLLVATCRSEELGAQHPARPCLEALRRRGAVPVLGLELPPLDRARRSPRSAGEALRCEPERAGPLAELVLRKTGGNPFFVRRLLRFLHKEDLLGLDREQRGLALGPGPHRQRVA